MEAVGEPISKKQKMDAVADWNGAPKCKEERQRIVQRMMQVVTVKEPEHRPRNTSTDEVKHDAGSAAADDDESSSLGDSEATSKRYRGDTRDDDSRESNASCSDYFDDE